MPNYLTDAIREYRQWRSLHTWRPLQDAIGRAFREGYLTHAETLNMATAHTWN